MKRLLSEDYINIVAKCFSQRDCDFYDYYSNVIDEQEQPDQDTIRGLKNAINHWLKWYLHETFPPVYETLDNGEKKRVSDSIPVPSQYKNEIRSRVDLDFFENQRSIIRMIEILRTGEAEQPPGANVDSTKLEDVVKPGRLEEFWEKCAKDIDPDTHYWKGQLDRLSATLKALKTMLYLKEGIKRLSQKQKIAIAKNTFDCDITNVVSKPSDKSPLDFLQKRSQTY